MDGIKTGFLEIAEQDFGTGFVLYLPPVFREIGRRGEL
jgi:hypothetical protein